MVSRVTIFTADGRSKAIEQNISFEQKVSPAWMDQIYRQLTSTQTVVKACIGWICELGITREMPFQQQANLALINRAAFISLMLALPGTFLLILMGFSHPFGLLISGVAVASLTLGLNGAKRVDWSVQLFAFSPSTILIAYSLLEISSGGLTLELNYLLIRQALCFALLLPLLLYGYEERQKVLGVLGVCLLAFLVFEVGSTHFGAFRELSISGLDHGMFSILSLSQYAGLAGCLLYMQHQTKLHQAEILRTQEKLQKMAIKDGLTGLYNHRFMEELVDDAINRSKRSHTPLALLMIDVDFFKQVNDTFGHNAGDEVLRRLTRLLRNHKRSTDYLGRWGGDELIMLLTDTDLSGAANVAEKYRMLVKDTFFPHSKQLTISLGASEYKEGETPTSFIGRADAALYRAKRGGRNRVEFHPAEEASGSLSSSQA